MALSAAPIVSSTVIERGYQVRLLKQTRGNITQAAKPAQRNRSEFYSLLQRHSLEPTDFKGQAALCFSTPHRRSNHAK